MNANPRSTQKKNPRVPEGRGGGRVAVMKPQIWIPASEKINLPQFSPMSATPENAEATPKDGLVNPSTAWWARGRICNEAVHGVDS
jgi:hypothetical protein